MLDDQALTHRRDFERMTLIRTFEERCLALSTEGLIAGSIHLCLGQEAVPVGAMDALGPGDRVVATYRGHGWAIECGVPLDSLLGEICQRAGGVNGGRAGSPFLTAPDYRLVGENSIVGAGVPIAAGIALASEQRSRGDVAVVSVGDGAMSQGATHEGLVLAGAKNLPMVVICENNGWSEMTPTGSMVRGTLADRVRAYGIESRAVDGNDPRAVRQQMEEAVGWCREGRGPFFLECRTVRLSGHYNRDIEHYRPKEDKAAAERDEPLARLRNLLLQRGWSTEAELDEVVKASQVTVDAAEAAVRAMPEPDPATARDHVELRAKTTARPGTVVGPATEMTYQRAANAALLRELESRPEVLVYGEDVGRAGGIFGVTRSLQKQFGERRVFDTPIAESAILGSALGAAMSGLRPVVEIMWADFVLVALDQLVNQAANVRYVSRGEVTAPMVVRMQQGVTPGSCAQHSQSLEALLLHVPGIKVGLPATPHDAYAMLRAAIADPDPCVVLEARALYQTKGPVALDEDLEGVGGARLLRSGTDAGIITWGTMVQPALAAAELLASEGLSVAVLDLRWLRPMDDDAIADLVASTSGRICVAHEANLTGGAGAEVAARIQDAHFDQLSAPVSRVAMPDVRVPSAPSLQAALVPGESAIADSCRRLVDRAARR